MADNDGGGLLVQIGVTQARMERDLAAVIKQMEKAAKQGEDAFKNANDNIGAGSKKSFDNVAASATKAGGAIKNTSGYTANLASQLNDIGTQLAGGQSPFLIMIQQGTQISQLFTQTGGSIKDFGALLVGAAKSAINPFSLLTYAVIGLGGAAVQYFASVVSGGSDANQTIEQQQKLIESVAETWGNAVPALQNYVQALKDAKSTADAIEAGKDFGKVTFDPITKKLNDLKPQFADLVQTLGEADRENPVIGRLQDAWQRVNEATAQGREDIQANNDLLSALADGLSQTGIPSLKSFSQSFQELTGQMKTAGQTADEAKGQLLGAIAGGASVQDIAANNTFSDYGKTFRPVDFIPKGDIPTPSNAPDQSELNKQAVADQTDLLSQLKEAYGGVVTDIQSYIDANEQAASAVKLRQAVENESINTWTQARNSLYSFNDANSEFIQLMATAAQNSDDPLNKLAVAYENLQQKVLNGTATAEDFQKVSEALPGATATGADGVADFGGAFQSFASNVLAALGALTQFQNQAAGALNTAAKVQSNIQNTIQTATQLNNGRTVQTPPSNVVLMDDGSYSAIPTPGARPSNQDEFPGGGFSKGARKSGGGRGAHAFEDEVTNIKDRTTALQAETAAQASVNPLIDDYGFALAKAQAQQKLLADAQKSGVAITPALRDQIDQLATGYANATVASKQLSDSQKQIQKNAEEWNDTEKDVFKGFLSDLKDGKSGAEALSDALNKLSDKLLDMAVDSLFSTKSGGAAGAGTNIFGSIFSGIGKLFGFASGTANTGSRPGQPVGIVHGQEAVIPLPMGGKVPVQISTPTATPSGGGSNDVVRVVLQDDSGRMAGIADQRIQTHSGTIVQIATEQSYNTVKSNMPGLMQDAQSRNF